MNKAFLHFNDSATKSGLLQMNPGLVTEFQQLTETFTNCVKNANERTLDSDEEDYNEAAPEKETLTTTVQVQTTQPITPPETEQTWDYAAITHSNKQVRPQVDATQSQGYFSHISSSSYALPETDDGSSVVHRRPFTVTDILDQSTLTHTSYQPQTTNNQSAQQQQQRQEQPLPFGLVDLPSREQSPFVPPYIFPVNIPAIGAEIPPPTLRQSLPPTISLRTKTLSPIFTYSHEEVTFARRLMRATLEAGFHLLSASNVPPEILNHKFKLSLPYVNLDEIRARFKTLLSRGINEDLDWWTTPFIHLGGAGTHYQRRDSRGNAIPMKNSWTVRQIGPLDRRMIRVENVEDGQTQDLQGIDLDGFQGEWFDAYDVQGYLEEQWHCRIDLRSSFAECLIEDEDSQALDAESESPTLSRGSTTATNMSSTPPIPQAFNELKPSYGLDMAFHNVPIPNFPQAPPKQSLLDLSFDQTLGLDLAPGFDMGFAGNDGYNMLNMNMMDETERLPVVRQKQKKVALVDVTKLVNCKSRVSTASRRSSC
jgi:hypothetical protein